MSLLADLPHGGLLAHMADKAVRAASPRQHIQTRDAEHVVVRTDKTNILIRSLQQKRRQTTGGGASHTEVASSAVGSGDKGKKRAHADPGEGSSTGGSCRAQGTAKRQLLTLAPSANSEGRARGAASGESAKSASRGSGKESAEDAADSECSVDLKSPTGECTMRAEGRTQEQSISAPGSAAHRREASNSSARGARGKAGSARK